MSLNISFDKSADDGAGANDVAHYSVRYSTANNPPLAGDEVAQTAATGAASYTQNVPHTNGATAYYGVAAVDGAGNVSAAVNGSVNTAAPLAVEDTFTGTDGALLTARAGETGATWTAAVKDAYIDLRIASNRVEAFDAATSNSLGTALYTASGAPASADAYAEVDLVYNVVGDGTNVGVVLRYANANNFLYGRWDYGGGSYNVFENVGGTLTQLGAVTGIAKPASGQTRTLRLEVVGTAPVLKVDGVAVIGGASGVACTPTTITAAGGTGLRVIANSAARTQATKSVQIDAFRAADL